MAEQPLERVSGMRGDDDTRMDVEAPRRASTERALGPRWRAAAALLGQARLRRLRGREALQDGADTFGVRRGRRGGSALEKSEHVTLHLIRHGLELRELRSAGRYGARAGLGVGVGRPLADEHRVGD